MEGRNIPGSLIVTLVLLALVGYAIYRAVDLDWNLFFKVLGGVALVAVITSIMARGGDRA